MKIESPLIAAAAAFYRLLIYLYPNSFRQEFGREMVLIFRDASQFEHAQRGTSALLGLWIAFTFDLITTAFVERTQEVITVSTSNFNRIVGAGAALAGIYWIFMLFAELNGMVTSIADSYVLLPIALGAVLVVLVAAAIYQQGSHNIAGTTGLAILAIGSTLLALSALFYAFNVDFDDGRAFGLQFLGHTISGLGILIIGFNFRARGYFKGWSTILVALGFFVMLFWPLIFAVVGLMFDLDLSALDGSGDLIYGADVVAQGLTWIILGLMAYSGLSEPEEQHHETPLFEKQ